MSYDLVIYGGTPAGIAAAVQAVRLGMKPVIVEPSNRLGGLSSGGLGDTDFGDKSAIGGLALEFYRRLGEKYGSREAVWTFEPKTALAVFRDWVSEYGIEVRFGEKLDLANGVALRGNRIASIRLASGATIHGKMFVDAGYEGDLMKAAGVSYSTGREANRTYGERSNGIQTRRAVLNQLPRGIDPYLRRGDPASGLLPGVNPDAGGQDGEADGKIQAYCYRMCLTDDPRNRVKVERPAGYDESEYELLFRAIERGQTEFFKLHAVPNRKTDSNNIYGFSTDWIGRNYDYPEADYAGREKIAEAHRIYQTGLVWTVQSHPRVPKDIRAFYEPWGLPLDEFADTGHWTPQLYVREARRMLGCEVMNENHVFRKAPVPDSIGLGSYTMDSHNTQRHVSQDGDVLNEGDVQIPLDSPYPISYRAIVPKEEECANLLVPVCLSASHIAYGSIRMEPVFLVLGQSAATAAALALDADVSLQKVEVEKLRLKLLEDGQVLD